MKLSILALALIIATGRCCGEETFYFSTILSATNEVPPAADIRVMRATFALSGHRLEYRSQPAFYRPPFSLRGPAGPGTNGPIVSPLMYHFQHPHPPPGFYPGGYYFSGELSMTDEQIIYLFAGLLYVEADGAARGQIFLDSDLDFVPDSRDNCPETLPNVLVDSEGCSIEQLCPCNGPWRGHGEYVSCMQRATSKFISEELISESQQLELVKQAAQSQCGKR